MAFRDYIPYLDSIDARRDSMIARLSQWCAINTGTDHVAGLDRFRSALARDLRPLRVPVRTIPLQPQVVIDHTGAAVRRELGAALLLRARPRAAVRLFLGIHMDTVFPAGHPFQSVDRLDPSTLRGPGVVDAKGGLMVLLAALRAFERSPFSKRVGWDLLINPDEEIGSPGSAPLFAACAGRTQLGLVFEPALPDGALVSRRKGSGNFTIVVRGRSAHVGRDFNSGRNAIHALAGLVTKLRGALSEHAGVLLNVGNIEGGGPVNVVPDLAIARLNVRIETSREQTRVQLRLDKICEDLNRREGFSATLHGGFQAPPKQLDGATRGLLEQIRACGKMLGLGIEWRPSGGVCDGNRLAAAGLPTVDTLGARGGGLHTAEEYLQVDSLVERARLAALLMMRIGAGEIRCPGRRRSAL